MPLAKIRLYFDAQIGAITRTAPFQTLLGVSSSQTATTLGPLAIRESLSLLWATNSQALPGLFRTSWGHKALLEFTSESQEDIPWNNQRLCDPDQAEEEASRTFCPSSLEKINIWNFSFTC